MKNHGTDRLVLGRDSFEHMKAFGFMLCLLKTLTSTVPVKEGTEVEELVVGLASRYLWTHTTSTRVVCTASLVDAHTTSEGVASGIVTLEPELVVSGET